MPTPPLPPVSSPPGTDVHGSPEIQHLGDHAHGNVYIEVGCVAHGTGERAPLPLLPLHDRQCPVFVRGRPFRGVSVSTPLPVLLAFSYLFCCVHC